MSIEVTDFLPTDTEQAHLVGRVWQYGTIPGPAIVGIKTGDVFDITGRVATMAELLNHDEPLSMLQDLQDLPCLGSTAEILLNSFCTRREPHVPYFLAPCDIQPLKAAGVTFIGSLVERVIEEQAGGDAVRAAAVRERIETGLGERLRDIIPGSGTAARAREILVSQGLWSQYLEVGIGPWAEIFTKSQPMSAVGFGAEIGIHPESQWNNPEPEIVLAISARGKIIGASLGNDVNLRDVEGRSALLLGRAKDNNGSCAVGPCLRLLDDNFPLETLRRVDVRLQVAGEDGFHLTDSSSLADISRPLEDLMEQLMGTNHQYPDGVMFFTGTMFTPTRDREVKDGGFTHKLGDTVSISSPSLGTLWNRVGTSDQVAPWSFGISALMHNLAKRGYL